MAERRVLIVEPDGTLAARLRGVLERCGLAVDVLGDGHEVLERVGDPMPDLVLLDVEPTVGDSICKQVKKRRKNTPVILVSAQEERGANRFRSRFGAHPDAVLRKPVAFDELMKQMDLLLGLDGMMTAFGASEEVEEILLDDLEAVEHHSVAGPLPQAEPQPVSGGKSTLAPNVPPPTPAAPDPDEREWRKKRELATLREALHKRGEAAKVGPSGEEQQRLRQAEAERDRLRQELGELRRRAGVEKTALERELGELRKALAEKDQQIVANEAVTAKLQAFNQNLSQERNGLAARLQEGGPGGPAAEASAAEAQVIRERDQLAAEQAKLRQTLAEKEQELLSQRTKLEAERDRLASELAEARAAAQAFAREHELLDLRQRVNQKDKQILDLKDEVGTRERQILDHKQETLQVERKASALEDNIVELEQKILEAKEHIAGLGQEMQGLQQTLAGARQELVDERERGRDALSAAQAEHAQELAALRETHTGEMAALRQAEEQARAALQAEGERTLAAARAQAQGELAAQEQRRLHDLEQADQRRQGDLAAQAGEHRAELERRADEHRGEITRLEREHELALAAAHEAGEARLATAAEQHAEQVDELKDRHATELKQQAERYDARISQLVHEHERQLAEQEESFRDLKLGMRQRHAAELDEVRSKHAAEVEALSEKLKQREAQVAALEGSVAAHKASIAELERQVAGLQDDLAKAVQKIQGDSRLAERARKALAIAVALLDQQLSSTHAGGGLHSDEVETRDAKLS